MAAGTEQIASVLSSLEPLFGASFAINLAYLNLKHFRYGETLVNRATDILNVEGGIGLNNPRFTGCNWYDQISSLINHSEEIAQGKDNPQKLNLPFSYWALVYRVLFHKIVWHIQIDRFIACLATFLSAAYLVLGVTHSVGRMKWSEKYFTQPEIGNELIYSILFLMWPIAMVSLGASAVFFGVQFIEYQLKGIKATSETEAQQTPPDLPDLP